MGRAPLTARERVLWAACEAATKYEPRCPCRALITSSIVDGLLVQRFCANGHHWFESTDPLDPAFIRRLSALRARMLPQTGTGYY